MINFIMIKDILIIGANAFSCGLLYFTTKEVITGKYKKIKFYDLFNIGFIFGALSAYMYTVIQEPIIPYLLKN